MELIKMNEKDFYLDDFEYYHSDLKEFDSKKNKQKPYQRIKLIGTFSRSYLLTILILDNIDTSRLISIRSMCNSCYNLKYVSLKKWNVRSLINCDYCFANCPKLEIIEIEWENINSKINCFMSLYNTNPLIISNTDFKFDKFSPYPCVLY